MLKLILFTFIFTSNFFALEISIKSAKEDSQIYSILHIRDKNGFVCESIKNDFKITTKIICAFSNKPSNKINKLQNDFFKITTKIKNKTFFTIITPLQKAKLLPIAFNMRKDDSIYQPKINFNNHWMIVGYKKKLPFIINDQIPENGINIPFFMDKDKLPFVGGLDLKGNPVHIKKVQDVASYIKIKKQFNDEKFDNCLELINDVQDEYPNSLFNAELLYYKIKVYDKLHDYDNIIDSSKVYLREYSSDENIAEVLALTANAYSKVGMNTDADYFFDRLFTEHLNSKYCKLGYIYKADMLVDSGGVKPALNYYNKALLETNDLDIAATAAYKLASYYLDNSKYDEASSFIMKIYKAKADFFNKNFKDSISVMHDFASHDKFITAATIAKALLQEITPKNDLYEKLLNDRALWLSKTDDKLKALKALNEYISKYPNGDYIDEINVAKDALFFDTNDENDTAKLKKYNYLIDTYNNDQIGQRAIYEKYKLLLKDNNYSSILNDAEIVSSLDEEKYPDAKNMVQEAAIIKMQVVLKNKECHEVLSVSNEYNITISSEWDEQLYDCAMMGGDFSLAKEMASKNLKTKDLDKRKEWLFRYVKVDFSTGNYSEAIDASKDLIALIKDDKNSKYLDVHRILFDAYQRVENKTNMQEIIVDIENIFGQSYKDIDRYVAMMSIASDIRDSKMIVLYGKKVFDIQIRSQSFSQTPYVEFTLYQAYIDTENYTQALDTIKSLDNRTLDKKTRAREKYLLGTIYDRLWRADDAAKAYDEAIAADPSSSWAKLAKDAKNI